MDLDAQIFSIYERITCSTQKERDDDEKKDSTQEDEEVMNFWNDPPCGDSVARCMWKIVWKRRMQRAEEHPEKECENIREQQILATIQEIREKKTWRTRYVGKYFEWDRIVNMHSNLDRLDICNWNMIRLKCVARNVMWSGTIGNV